MKLRNKKTGAIYDVFLREREVGGYACIIVCDKKAYMQSKTKFGVTNYVLDEYSSLSEFNEEWEDVTPLEFSKYYLINEETGYMATFDSEREMKIFQNEIDGWKPVKVLLDD